MLNPEDWLTPEEKNAAVQIVNEAGQMAAQIRAMFTDDAPGAVRYMMVLKMLKTATPNLWERVDDAMEIAATWLAADCPKDLSNAPAILAAKQRSYGRPN
jgi:hypothetical protein